MAALASLFVKITADSRDVDSSVARVRSSLTSLDRQQVQPKISMATDVLNRDIAGFQSKLQALGRQQVKLNVDSSLAKADVATLTRQLDTLQRQRHLVPIELRGDIDRQIKTVQGDLAAVSRKQTTVPLALERVDGKIAAVKTSLSALERNAVDIPVDVDKRGLLRGKLASIRASVTSLGGVMIATLGAAGLGRAIGDTISKAGNFEAAIKQVGVATGATGPALKTMTDLALRMGKETTFSAQGAADAMLELAKGGLTQAQIKAGALQATLTLAAAGGLQLGAASTYVVQGLTTFGLKASQAGVVAAALAGGANASTASVESMGLALSQVGPGAKLAGLSIQETTAALAAFDNAGVKGADAGTSLKTMLTRLVPSTEAAKNKMRELGIDFTNADGSFKSLTEISQELQNGLKGLTAEQKTTALATMFGSDATRAASILAVNGAAGIGKLIKATSDQGAASALAQSKTEGFKGAMEAFKGSVETLQIQLGTKLMPVLTKVLKWLSTDGYDAAVKFGSALAKLGPVVAGIGSVIGAVFGAMSRHATTMKVLAAAVGLVVVAVAAQNAAMAVAAAGGLAKYLTGTKIVTAATKAWAAVQWALNVALRANPIALVVTALVAAAAAAVYAYKHFDTFRAVVDTIGRALKVGFVAALNTVRSALAGVAGVVTTAWNAIKTATATVFGAVSVIIRVAVGAWLAVIKRELAAASVVVQAAWAALKAVTTAAFAAVRAAVTVAWAGIRTAFTAGTAVVKAVWGAFWGALRAVVGAVFNAIRAFITAEWNVIKTVFAVAQKVVSAAWSAFWNALRTVATAVFNAIKAVVTTIWTGVKAVFTAAMGVLKAAWTVWWGALRTIGTAVFTAIKSVVTTIWIAVRALFTSMMAALRTAWSAWWTVLRTTATTMFTAIRTVITTIWNAVRALFTSMMAALRVAWSVFWTALRTTATTLFNAIKATISSVWASVRGVWTGAQNAVRSSWSAFWGAVKATASSAMSGVQSLISAALGRITSAFATAKSNIGKVWSGVQSVVSAPINWIRTNVYNNTLVPVWNRVAGLVGGPQLSAYADGGIVPAFARGGIAGGYTRRGIADAERFANGGVYGVRPGYTPGRDTHTIAVSGGEAIMRPEWTRAAGADYVHGANAAARNGGIAGANAFIQKMGLPGFADGGVVGKFGVPGYWPGGVVDFLKSAAGAVGGAVGGILSKTKGFVLGGLQAAASAALSPIRSLIASHLQGNGVNVTVGKIATKAIDLLLAKIGVSDAAATAAAAAATGGGGSTTGGAASIKAFLQTIDPKPYIWGGVGPGGYDCIAAGTLITTDRGDVPIELVTAADRVLTRNGWRRVMRAWKVRDNAETASITVNGRRLIGTPDHRVWTDNRGWIALSEITSDDIVVSCPKQRFDTSTASATTFTRNLSGLPIDSTSSVTAGFYTGPFGVPRTALSWPATKYITSTTTPSTMTSATLHASRSANIVREVLRPVACITTNARSAEPAFSRSATLGLPAVSAPRSTSGSFTMTRGKRRPLRRHLAVLPSMCARTATFLSRGLYEPAVHTASVAAITKTSSTERRDVYDLTVEGEHEFFANGVLVHNCSGLVGEVYARHTGRPSYRRYFTTASLGSGGGYGFKPGAGGVFSVGNNPGHHMAGEYGGFRFEAESTATGIKVGSAASGVSGFQEVMHMARGGIADLANALGMVTAVAGDPDDLLVNGRRVRQSMSGLELASGGLVRGGRGGVLARIGEGRQDELVTPLPSGWNMNRKDTSLDRLVALLEREGIGDTSFTFNTHNPIAEPQSVTTNKALQRVSNLGLV